MSAVLSLIENCLHVLLLNTFRNLKTNMHRHVMEYKSVTSFKEVIIDLIWHHLSKCLFLLLLISRIVEANNE